MIDIRKLPTMAELAQGIETIQVTVPSREAVLEKALRHMRVQNGSYQPGHTAAKGDIVYLKVWGGENPRFQKERVGISLGLGLYSAEVEAAVIGMQAGETITVTLAHREVSCTVLEVKKKVYGEVTLAQVQAEDPLCRSVAAYGEKCYREACDACILKEANARQIGPMVKKLTQQADIVFDYEDADAGLKARFGPEAALQLRDVYVMVAFCEANGADLSEAAYEKEVQAVSAKYQMPVEAYRENYPYHAFRYINVGQTLGKLLLAYLKQDHIQLTVQTEF